jgi:hypothetical protein
MKATIWMKDAGKAVKMSIKGITVEELVAELMGMDQSKVSAVECKSMKRLNYLLGRGGSEYSYGK